MRVAIVLVTWLFIAIANAASIDLIYTGDNPVTGQGTIVASAGDVITLDIFFDFTGEPTLGGGFNVFYTASQLDFLTYDIADFGEPAFNRAPDVAEDGVLLGASVGDYEALEFGLLAQMSFLVTGNSGFSIELRNAPGLGGAWISAIDFVTLVTPTFGRIDGVSPVPVPAAAWLFGSALLGLGAIRRKS